MLAVCTDGALLPLMAITQDWDLLTLTLGVKPMQRRWARYRVG